MGQELEDPGIPEERRLAFSVARFMNRPNLASKVAVVLPCYRSPLTEEEYLSWRSLESKIPNVSRFIVAPETLRKHEDNLPSAARIFYFPDSFFTYPRGYNALLLSTRFYELFKEFEFLLLYQLDCLICRDELDYWCGQNWDYIGAPWAKHYHTKSGVEFVGVGNGGFSLRSVSSALRVLKTKISAQPDYSMGPLPHWWHWKRVRKIMLILNRIRALFPDITVEQLLRKHYSGNEDIFWGLYAPKIDPDFKVASVIEALQFAFETEPAGSYEKNNRQLPFGCHAWARYDRDFWEKMGLIPKIK